MFCPEAISNASMFTFFSLLSLKGANLRGATVSKEQLDRAYSLEGATMLNGQKYEDWFNSRGEDVEKPAPS